MSALERRKGTCAFFAWDGVKWVWVIMGLRECVEGGVQKNEVGRLWGVDSTQTKQTTN